MSTRKTGREMIVAMEVASIWDTPVVVGAGDGLLITDGFTAPHAPTFAPRKDLGQIEQCPSDLVFEPPYIDSFSMLMRYDSLETILFQIGGSAITTGSAAVNSAWTHNIGPALTNTDGNFVTLVTQKQSAVTWEVPTAKLTDVEMIFPQGDVATMTVNFAGSKVNVKPTVNSAATMANVTYDPATCEDVVVQVGESAYVRTNKQSATALTSAHGVFPRTTTVRLGFPYNTDIMPLGEDTIAEPPQSDAGAEIGEIVLAFDTYAIQTFRDAIDVDQVQKVEVNIPGGALPPPFTTLSYDLTLQFPAVQWQIDEAPPNGPDIIPNTVTGKLFAPATSSVASGMTGFVKHWNVIVKNTVSTATG